MLSLLSLNMANARELSDQRKMLSVNSPDVEYRIALGAITKVNAVNSVEREIQLRSNVVSSTYEFDRDLSVERAWMMLEAGLAGDKRLLYACDGLACGSSNSWANDIFSIKQLYGLDQSQKYRVYALQQQVNTYKVVYFVQRGNKKIYAHVDTVVPLDAGRVIAPSKSAIDAELTNQGYYSLQLSVTDNDGGQAKIDEEELSALVATMRAKPLAQYYLVGHSYLSSDLQANTDQAESYVNTLLQKLTAARLPERRFETHAVGNLAPRSALPKERVTIIQKSRAQR